MAPIPAAGTHFRRDLYLLSATFVFVFMGAGAQQAYLVPYLSRVTDWSKLQCSSIVACVYLGMMVFRLGNLRLFPHWSDRRYTLVGAWAYFAFTVLMALVAFVPVYPFAVVAAGLWGAGAAMMWTGTSMQILRLSDQAGGRHGTGMGILYTSLHAGWLAGAILLGLLYDHLDSHRLYLVYVAAAVITLPGNLLAMFLPASGTPARCAVTLAGIFDILRRPRAQIAAALQFVAALGYGLILGAFTRYVESEYGANWIWVTVSLYPATLMALSWIGGALNDRVGQSPVLVSGFVAGAVGLAVTVFFHSPYSAVLTAFALGLLNSTVSVSASAIVGKAAEPERRPMVYGVVFAARDLGIVTAAVGATALGNRIPMNAVFGLFAVVFAACAGLSLMLARYTRQRL
jgi:MFS family permease